MSINSNLYTYINIYTNITFIINFKTIVSTVAYLFRTDAVIQKTIRNKFQKCTVLTIAHRLNTVIDSDRIIVVDDGSIVEFDHPFNLLKHKGGFFYKMAEETGQNTAEMLERMATEVVN